MLGQGTAIVRGQSRKSRSIFSFANETVIDYEEGNEVRVGGAEAMPNLVGDFGQVHTPS